MMFQNNIHGSAISAPQQLPFGLLHLLKVKALYDLLHQGGNGLVAQVADTTFVGVGHLLLRH